MNRLYKVSQSDKLINFNYNDNCGTYSTCQIKEIWEINTEEELEDLIKYTSPTAILIRDSCSNSQIVDLNTDTIREFLETGAIIGNMKRVAVFYQWTGDTEDEPKVVLATLANIRTNIEEEIELCSTALGAIDEII